jgi:hypothetical protein
MLPLSIVFGEVRVFFLCLVPNVTRVYRFWWGPCLSFCVLCPMLPVSIVFGGVRVFFLCLVPNVTRVYFLLLLSVSSNVYRLLFIEQSVIEYKTWMLIKFLWHGHVYHAINIVIINFSTGYILMSWLYGGRAGESQNIYSQNAIKLTN